MATYRQLSKQRQELVDDLDRKLSRRILSAQRKLLNELISKISANIAISAETLSNSATNIYRSSQIVNDVFETWLRKEGLDIARFVADNIFNVQNLNERYYRTFMGGAEVRATASGVLSTTLNKYGVTPSGKLRTSGYLFESIANPTVINQIKSVVSSGIQSVNKLNQLNSNLRNLLGESERAGIFERTVAESLPSGLLQVDRDTNTDFATKLQLNYAIYQGGVIKTSRPFCEERNNKVFSRDEIMAFGTPQDKFGGYTNKSAGEFQGKTQIYNPLTDLGGYNCRHGLDWISDELAFLLRPELKTN